VSEDVIVTIRDASLARSLTSNPVAQLVWPLVQGPLLCGQCKVTDSERCYYPACPLYVAP
jgi:hypothetical protein